MARLSHELKDKVGGAFSGFDVSADRGSRAKELLSDRSVAHFTVGGEAIFNPFQWVFDTSPQFISGRVQMQYHCSERLSE